MTEKKLRGEIRRSGAKAVADLSGLSAQSLYFDGKINKVVDTVDNRQTVAKKDNISVVIYGDENARGRYAGFAEAEDGTGIEMATSLLDHFDAVGINYKDSLKMVASDATNANTGRENGALAHFQSLVGRTLQFNVCLIHHNELPFKHLTADLGIVTKSDVGLSGPENDPDGWETIGEELSTDLWERPISSYDPIMAPELEELEPAQWKLLSNDAKYMYRICMAATKGERRVQKVIVKVVI